MQTSVNIDILICELILNRQKTLGMSQFSGACGGCICQFVITAAHRSLSHLQALPNATEKCALFFPPFGGFFSSILDSPSYTKIHCDLAKDFSFNKARIRPTQGTIIHLNSITPLALLPTLSIYQIQ